MLNRIAHFLLACTSLSPILGAVAVNQYARGKPWMPWLITAALLTLICCLVLKFAAVSGQKHKLKVGSVEDKDKEVLAFLLVYFLPFVSGKDALAEVHWATVTYVFVVIILVFSHARALHFNPVMGLLGYHFYNLKDGDGAKVLLISRSERVKIGAEITGIRMAHDIYLQAGDGNV